MIYLKIKRILDFLLALFCTILLLPIGFLIAIAIKLDSKGPVIFTQKRVGRNRKMFNIYKFRTMQVDAPPNCLHNIESYFTRVGRFLRATSLDELPQLINILLGQMSFIGPRPVIEEEAELLAERDKNNANSLTPGLTGWTQVNGRNQITPIMRAWYDGEYVKKISFWFDLKIFFITIFKVLKREDIRHYSGRNYEFPEEQKKEKKMNDPHMKIALKDR